jgi:hypothetical protein
MNDLVDWRRGGNVFFRPHDPEQTRPLLFIYMNTDQQYLLKRYGERVLLDATYKTLQYPFPIFQLVVKTNVDYQVSYHFIS